MRLRSSNLRVHVLPERVLNQRAAYRERWWLHVRPRPAFRGAVARMTRYIVTPTVAKHRLFAWQQRPTLSDHQLIVVAREDDYTFGVLHSRVHELWSLRKGTSLEDRPRYTPTTTFETFPFPWPLNTPDDDLTPAQAADRNAIARAARELHERRERWLNPPELARMAPDVLPHLPPRPVALNEVAAKQLARRTLTNLYNVAPGLAGPAPPRPRPRRARGLPLARRPFRRRDPAPPARAQPRTSTIHRRLNAEAGTVARPSGREVPDGANEPSRVARSA